ncbi:MAPEG family protein [Pseudaminobacter salicylatoxidans]|uniref:MAPEG family protein n=1 Tax=Pseudaminobacter salicylatoxidans TaxID=93369 RepID=UPI00037F6882|nr:MAPEG family protein [Pseudaminobacter salicylatoxidans]
MNHTAVAAVGLYTVLNTAILFWLIVATSRLRRRYKVWVGTGGVAHLERVMRGHANAIENMPMTLLLLLIAALLGTPVLALHLLGIAFTIGRVLHAWHFIEEKGAPWQREAGFGLSGLATVVAMAVVLGHAFGFVI